MTEKIDLIIYTNNKNLQFFVVVKIYDLENKIIQYINNHIVIQKWRQYTGKYK